MREIAFYLEVLKLTDKVPLYLILMLKHKISFSFIADFQKIKAEIPFTPSYLELCKYV